MIIWKKNYREYSPFFPPEAPAPKNNRFRGTFENSIGYVYQEKHVPRCWGKYFLKTLHGLYVFVLFIFFNKKLKNVSCEYDRLNG